MVYSKQRYGCTNSITVEKWVDLVPALISLSSPVSNERLFCPLPRRYMGYMNKHTNILNTDIQYNINASKTWWRECKCWTRILFKSLFNSIVLLLLLKRLKERRRCKGPKYKRPFSIDYRERRSHERGVYLTQYTSRMNTARVKEEIGPDTRIIVNPLLPKFI